MAPTGLLLAERLDQRWSEDSGTPYVVARCDQHGWQPLLARQRLRREALRSVKYEEVCLHGYETVSDVRAGPTRYFQFFNQRRPYCGLHARILDSVYFDTLPEPRTPSPRAVPLIDAA